MFPWKRKAEQPLATEDDLPGFTSAERARLQFARWLVKHGRLSEGKDGQKEPSTVPWWKRQPSTSSTPAESSRGNR